jgi:hypothetical protein
MNRVPVWNRALRAGTRVEAVQPATQTSSDHNTEWTLTIDGGFVRGRRQSECSSFEVLTGRLFANGLTPRTFAFVRDRLPDIAARLSSFVEAATSSRNPAFLRGYRWCQRRLRHVSRSAAYNSPCRMR